MRSWRPSAPRKARADLSTLLYWVRERESIRVRKERGDPFPWTDDPILRDWRFCNVRREDDYVTKWIDQNIRRRFADHPHLWFMMCIARMINWPDTLDELIGTSGWPDHPQFGCDALGTILGQRAARGDKVFTGAYLIPPASGQWQTKGQGVATVTLGNLWRDRALLTDRFKPTVTHWIDKIPRTNKLRLAHEVLSRYEGWGPFLAYQVVVDMRFCPWLLANASDVSTWVVAGPGTRRGLNRVYGRGVHESLSQNQALDEMLPIFERCERETGVVIDLSDVPNILCETDKYCRVALGQGTPRARYVLGRGS
jgi:hypothetical protein